MIISVATVRRTLGAACALALVAGSAVAATPAQADTSLPPELHFSKTRIEHDQGSLLGIACTTHSFCAAVGELPDTHLNMITFSNAGKPRAQRLKGLTAADDETYDEVACGTPTFCVVGDAQHVHVWNGNHWHRAVHVPHVPYDGYHVSCVPGTERCVLSARDRTLVHGAHGWRVVPYPGKFHHELTLACGSPRFCLALRRHSTAVFDGRRWHDGGKRTHLGFGGSVTCATPTYCLAVGAGRAAVFNGTSWHAVPPHPGKPYALSMTCLSTHTCFVMDGQSVSTLSRGHWSRRAAPPAQTLTGFDCSPNAHCRAVNDRNQVVRFAHRRWQGADDLTHYTGSLLDVSCSAPDWCMAIDSAGRAVRYAGGQWSAPQRVDGRRSLLSISCTTHRHCVAVDSSSGSHATGLYSAGRALIYAHGHWRTDTKVDVGHALLDVSCASASFCVAVDDYGRAITYRSGTWSAPERVGGSAHPHAPLLDVACPTSTYCLAVGRYSYELRSGSWHRVAELPKAVAVDCPDPDYCEFVDRTGIEIRDDGVLRTALSHKNSASFGSVACADRDYCLVTGPFGKDDGGIEVETTYAVSQTDNRYVPVPQVWGASCVAGPTCVVIDPYHAAVGTT